MLLSLIKDSWRLKVNRDKMSIPTSTPTPTPADNYEKQLNNETLTPKHIKCPLKYVPYIYTVRKYVHKTYIGEFKRKQKRIEEREATTAFFKAKRDSPEEKAKRSERSSANYKKLADTKREEKLSKAFKIFHEAGNAKNNPILHPNIKEKCEKWFTEEQWDTVLDFIKFNNKNTDEDYTNYENCFIKQIYRYVNYNLLKPYQIAEYAKYSKYKLTQEKIIQQV